LQVKERKEIKCNGKIFSLSWCLDSRKILSASQDGKLTIWNALTSEKIIGLCLSFQWVMTCSYSPSGKLAACGGLDNMCSVYNLASDKIKKDEKNNTTIIASKELEAHTGYVSCCKFISDKNILTSSGDQVCILWDTENGSIVQKFQDHTGEISCISISPDQNTFLSGAGDCLAKLWDIRSGKCVQTFQGHESDISAIQIFSKRFHFCNRF